VSFIFMIMQSPERMGRMVAFRDPVKYQKDDA